MEGIFYGIGVGPGDPELLTVKAINAIKNCNVIIAPKTEKKSDSLALTIAGPYLRADVQIVYQTFLMVKHFEESPKIFEDNVAEILSYLRDGKNVGFLTLGDPMFFSTYIYIFKLLKNSGVKIETVAGVPAFLAIAAKIGYPVAYGNDILTIVPKIDDRLEEILDYSDSIVLMKASRNTSRLESTIEDKKRPKEIYSVQNCTRENEKIIEGFSNEKPYLTTTIIQFSDD